MRATSLELGYPSDRPVQINKTLNKMSYLAAGFACLAEPCFPEASLAARTRRTTVWFKR